MLETDLLRLTWIADPQISPDGRRIAFTRVTVDEAQDTYKTNLWIALADGGAPRALTFSDRDAQPRWSPTGDRLAFVRSPGEGKPAQLFVLPMGGGEATRLTDLPKGAGSPTWSPDGTRIAFTSATRVEKDGATTAEFEEREKAKPKKEPGRVVTRPFFRLDNVGFFDFEHPSHLWIVAADGGAPPRALTAGRYEESAPAFARDGKRVLFLSDRRPEPWFGPFDQDVWAVAVDRATPATDGDGVTLVADAAGPLGRFAECADGTVLATGSLSQTPPRSYDQGDLFRFEGPWPAKVARVLTGPYDFEVGDSTIGGDQHAPRGGGSLPLALAPGGRHALFAVGRHGTQLLARVGVDDGVVEELTDERWELQAGSATPDGDKLALLVGGHDRPCVLAMFDVASRTLTVLYDPNTELFTGSKLGAVEERWIPSFDGKPIHAWIVKPPDFDPAKRYPMILEIHGGPHTAYGKGFYHEFHVLAEAGYVVLFTNPRGSTTYGQEFGNCIQYAYPGDDAKDLMACVDAVIALGYVDANRLGVTGGSGGGLLTNWLITQTTRFKAAITQRCVAEWESFWYSADFTQFTPFWFKTAPFEDADDFRERSPVHQAAKIETPLLVLHGENDWRTPIAQGEAMFRALQSQKKPSAMARFPGEGHELTRSGAPSRRVQNQQLGRGWFDHWLLGKPAPQFDDPAIALEAEAKAGAPAAAAAPDVPAPEGEPATSGAARGRALGPTRGA
jgi:dipeptidyl aminopeptidase/acylaminoacyl peptidase